MVRLALVVALMTPLTRVGPYVYVGTTLGRTNRWGVAKGHIHFVKVRRNEVLGRLLALYALWRAVKS